VLQLEEEVRPSGVSELRGLWQLENENSWPKRLLADISLDEPLLSETLRGQSTSVRRLELLGACLIHSKSRAS